MRVEFFRTRPNGHRVVLAVGVCRLVFKEKNGKTIPPADFFSSLGYAVDPNLIGHGVGVSKTELLNHLEMLHSNGSTHDKEHPKTETS